MAKKQQQKLQKDWAKILDQTKENLRKFGQEASVWAKKSEKELVKASKMGKLQFDIAGINLQKEKIYYEIGKKVASLNSKDKKAIPGLTSYWKKMRDLEVKSRGKKRALSEVKKSS
jgi:hypothetical protein